MAGDNVAGDWLDVQQGASGSPQGPRLRGPMFVPVGLGVVFADDQGRFWQWSLALNSDGSVFYGEDGKPTVQLNQVVP